MNAQVGGPPIRCGDQVRVRATALDIRRGQEGTVVWVDRTSPRYTLVHIAWKRGGAGRVDIENVERV